MIDLTVAEAATVLGAEVVGGGDLAARLTDLVIDSRSVSPGSLFVALRGERVDGHDYLDAAWRSGAAAAVSDRPPASPDGRGPLLQVADPLAALGTLARHLVDRAARRGLRVVGITGSQGKTSTKDLLGQVLERQAPTVAPRGNLNNEIGVPLTVSRIGPDTRYLVSEMGARGVGHIAYLCRLTPPDVGIVLNIGHAHLGEFGSKALIARAKGELVEALPTSGVAVLNADDRLVWDMRGRTRASVLGFSVVDRPASERAVWARDITSEPDGCCRFLLHVQTPDTNPGALPVSLQLPGRHQVVNALAAAAGALALGIDPAEIAAGLSAAGPRSRWRMETRLRDDQLLVINDAYNANPDSMRAALETAAEIGRARRRQDPNARTWAVLGDMLELGETAAAEHTAIGSYVAALGFDRLIAVGDFAHQIASGARAAGLTAVAVHALRAKTQAATAVRADAGPMDTVLVKASRGLALETVAEDILRPAQPTTPTRQQTADSEDRS